MIVKPEDIDSQIAALDAAASEFSQEADELALAVVAGDGSAATALTDINRRIEGARRDRDVLVRARRVAVDTQNAERERLSDEARERHLAEARLNVSGLIETAKRIDALTSDLKTAVVDLQTTETAIHRSLSAARSPADSTVVGRRGLATVAIARLNGSIAAEAYRQTGKTVEETARIAWRFLAETDEPEEVA